MKLIISISVLIVICLLLGFVAGKWHSFYKNYKTDKQIYRETLNKLKDGN